MKNNDENLLAIMVGGHLKKFLLLLYILFTAVGCNEEDPPANLSMEYSAARSGLVQLNFLALGDVPSSGVAEFKKAGHGISRERSVDCLSNPRQEDPSLDPTQEQVTRAACYIKHKEYLDKFDAFIVANEAAFRVVYEFSSKPIVVVDPAENGERPLWLESCLDIAVESGRVFVLKGEDIISNEGPQPADGQRAVNSFDGFLRKLIHAARLGGLDRGSRPYVSGHTFREISDYSYPELIDEKNYVLRDQMLDAGGMRIEPEVVGDGSIVWVKLQHLSRFFEEYHTRIPGKYILITHSDDDPSPGEFGDFLEDDKIIAWFGKNSSIDYHPKFHSIPLGLSERYWPHGDVDLLTRVLDEHKSIQPERDIVLYANFSNSTSSARPEVDEFCLANDFCHKAERKNWEGYLRDLGRSKFVLSPRGNGLDCHRTWEALLMGAIPVVISSTLDSLYEGLPVLIINNWNELTEEFLEKKYDEFSSQEFDMSKIYFKYWREKIENLRSEYLRGPGL